jgi:hypothetical protein
MAMNPNVLAANIVQEVLDELYDGGGGLSSSHIAGIEKIVGIIAYQVLEHIKNNAVVTVASGIKVKTAGSALAQEGATDETGTGTIT